MKVDLLLKKTTKEYFSADTMIYELIRNGL